MGRLGWVLLWAATAHAQPSPAPRYDLELKKDAWLSEQLERHNLEGGRVDPAWRAAARGIEASFAPDPAIVSQVDSATLWSRQTKRFFGGVRSTPQLEHRVDRDLADELRLERAYEDQPAEWQRVEVEAEVDERGVMTSLEVVSRTGKASLDEAAREAVKKALETAPLPRRRARVRFAVEAGVLVQPPTGGKSQYDPTPRPVGTFKFKFDESKGTLQPPQRIWFMRKLVKRVLIISIR